MPWFVQAAKYPPREGNCVTPLVNGQRAFAAVEAAIRAARHSVDIISWGFDPSMRFVPPNGIRIGQLLRDKAKAGVKVRVLVWKDVLAGFKENTLPGDGLGGSGGGSAGIGSGVGSTAPGNAPGKAGPFNDYGSRPSGRGSAGVVWDDPEAKEFTRKWFKDAPSGLSFRTRNYGRMERIELEWKFIQRNGWTSKTAQRLAFTEAASHHQKMVLVDYEMPEHAVGFVMGHNMHRNYWDTDAHEYYSEDRLYFQPWQDLSSRVRGPVLYDLNDNFSVAWTKAQPLFGSDQPIPASRASLKPEAFAPKAVQQETPTMAQITRTQPLDGDLSINASYHLALASTRRYAYFENQYFRHREIALKLRETNRKLKAAGCKQDIHVFVVTNVPDGAGRMNTYDMLQALGKSSSLPKVQKDQADEDKERPVHASELAGLKVVVCSLVSSGVEVTEPVAYDTGRTDDMGFPIFTMTEPTSRNVFAPIYVHSKLLLVDDVFFTLGSANINERSLFNDTELNIACPSPQLTKGWREHLWRIHTGRVPGEDMKVEFEFWDRTSKSNRADVAGGERPANKLLEFFDDGNPSMRLD